MIIEKIKKDFSNLGLPDPKKISGKSYVFYYKSSQPNGSVASGGIINHFTYFKYKNSFDIIIDATGCRSDAIIEYCSSSKKWKIKELEMNDIIGKIEVEN
ncbi:hypothetical protein KAS41_03445 [Candidatus Parcubacteria bacterium]|nr:hypothetical protein [Candidatus Parcubacteria bacterium]